jgi:hypothetical protein
MFCPSAVKRQQKEPVIAAKKSRNYFFLTTQKAKTKDSSAKQGCQIIIGTKYQKR